ncbi:deoxyribose-phosphate aldolase [Methylovirgula sp. 4M-Z18]|uniref:deoxyribose-phosphate aldolase n=1 Tax=Methylovirgula sp. 4M-Z18 TaxID=2293567 RepID=UPI000E2EE993|nr:deoxyribose-phosphate aldolase [Methylovirgula sp. 4M-Z18]RFB81351.1 deoxyribose-phosphate aldolase [Methylovirgula sp. 4M-Z18]
MTSDHDIARRALRLLDLTNLDDDCKESVIDDLCARAVTPHGSVAAICIWPRFVAQAKPLVAQSGVRIATVINFPHGSEDIERAIGDARGTLRDGADEIDLVMPYRALIEDRIAPVTDMIGAVADVTRGNARLKVILETGALQTPQLIAQASDLAIAAGADFIKTSTGKIPVSATPEAARIMLQAIKASGKPVGLKPSGGVRSVHDARKYLELADDIMGAGWTTPETFRFGASGLLASLLATLDGRDHNNTSTY